MLEFKSNGHLTLGVEVELQLLDPESLDLTSAAPALFERTAGEEKIKPEIFQSMAEINTGICASVQEVESDLRATMRTLKKATDALGVRVATAGTHPFARYAERKLFDSTRYMQLIDRNQWIARRLMIFGMHVHVGMRDGDTCIRFNNFFLHLVPHLLALTASSPFWQGEDTGLASCRSTIFESCPTAGHPCRLRDWADFSGLCANLIKSKAIGSHKDLWWDVRPSPDFGTVEIRICDGLATLSETLAVVAFIHALAYWYDANADYDVTMRAPHMWMMRENKWRATRYGMDAEIIASPQADLASLCGDIHAWLGELKPYAGRLGYGSYFEALARILEKGSSSIRQRAIYEKTGSLVAVARHNADEYDARAPIY